MADYLVLIVRPAQDPRTWLMAGFFGFLLLVALASVLGADPLPTLLWVMAAATAGVAIGGALFILIRLDLRMVRFVPAGAAAFLAAAWGAAAASGLLDSMAVNRSLGRDDDMPADIVRRIFDTRPDPAADYIAAHPPVYWFNSWPVEAGVFVLLAALTAAALSWGMRR